MSELATTFLTGLDDDLRARFPDLDALDATLTRLCADARAAYPELPFDPRAFSGELAQRLGGLASPAQLSAIRADHVHLAIACTAGSDLAIKQFEAELFDEVSATGARMRARPDQIDDARGTLRRVLFTAEPGRRAAVAVFSGRSDLRTYLRVIATRELVRVIVKGKDVAVDDHALADLVAPNDSPELAALRERYRDDVDAAIRDALANLPEPSRALLRYSVVDGWSIDRIGALYGIHRSSAARRVAAARDELAAAIRMEVSRRLAISIEEVDSIVRLVQSRIDVSLERLLADGE